MQPRPTTDAPKRRNDSIEDPDRVTAETDQDVDTAGTEADESAVGHALDQDVTRDEPRRPSSDRP